MLGWLTQLSAFTVFLAVGAVGFVFLLVTFLFGELFDHLDLGGHDFDHGVDAGAPSVFSSRVLAVFVSAFGTTGAIATFYGLRLVPASLAGLTSGFVFGGLIWLFARFLYSQQASSEVRAEELVGRAGRVVVAIPGGGVGQVRCRVGEELLDKIARTRDGSSIEENASVRVDAVLGETVIVSRA